MPQISQIASAAPASPAAPASLASAKTAFMPQMPTGFAALLEGATLDAEASIQQPGSAMNTAVKTATAKTAATVKMATKAISAPETKGTSQTKQPQADVVVPVHVPLAVFSDDRALTIGVPKPKASGSSGSPMPAPVPAAQSPSISAISQAAMKQQVAFTATLQKSNASATAQNAVAAVAPAAGQKYSASQHGQTRDQQSGERQQSSSHQPETTQQVVNAKTATHFAIAPAQAVTAQTASGVAAAYSGPAASPKAIPLSAPSPASVITDQQPLAPKPRSLELQVNGSDQSDVTVRVAQRAGDVEVTVRTADGDLAQSLRQHLPELSQKLSEAGVQGELWHAAGSSSTGGSGTDLSDESGRQELPQDRGRQQEQNQRQAAWDQALTESENS